MGFLGIATSSEIVVGQGSDYIAWQHTWLNIGHNQRFDNSIAAGKSSVG
jgi:hypothetical protein